jgi:uncharacterized protein YjaG (DUF416 family)
MELNTFIIRLEQRLETMTPDELLRFGLEISKRLYSDYAAFSLKHSWGDTDLLLDAINACESLESIPDLEVILDLRRRIDVIIPDTEEFGDHNGSYAFNASAAVACLLQYVLDKDATNIRDAATLYYDNIDFKLQESGVSNEVALANHPRKQGTRRFLLGEE